jgi:transposase
MTQIEIITGVERRRIWTLGDKERILREAFAPGVSAKAYARQNDMSSALLFTWRKKLWGSKREPGFTPIIAVDVDNSVSSLPLANSSVIPVNRSASHPAGQNEIVVEANGRRACIPSTMPPELAAAVVAALVKL